jgi:hypothetical protein
VRYEDLFSVQPFYNNLVTLTLSGAQLLQVLEQQLGRPAGSARAARERGFTTPGTPAPRGEARGARQRDAERPAARPGERLRVTVNSLPGRGSGDGFPLLTQGTDACHRHAWTWMRWRLYLKANGRWCQNRLTPQHAAELKRMLAAEIIRTKRDGGALVRRRRSQAFVQPASPTAAGATARPRRWRWPSCCAAWARAETWR